MAGSIVRVLVVVAGVVVLALALGGTAAAEGPDTPGCTLDNAIPVTLDQKYEGRPPCPSGTWYKLDMENTQRPVTIRMYLPGGPWSGMRSPFQVWTRGSGMEKFTKIGEATYKGSPWPGVSEWSWTGRGASPLWILGLLPFDPQDSQRASFIIVMQALFQGHYGGG